MGGVGIYGPRPGGTGGGGPVALAGDANGPSNANEVNSLTGTAGGASVPLGDMSAAALEVSVVLRDSAAGGGEYLTIPISAFPVPPSPTEYDHLISTRADLVAVVAPVAGVFNLPEGSYFLKTDVTLNAGESMSVAGTVLFAGGGESYAIGGNNAAVATFVVTGTGKLSIMNLTIAPPASVPCVNVQPGGTFSATNSHLTCTGDISLFAEDAAVNLMGGSVTTTNGPAVEFFDGGTFRANQVLMRSDAGGEAFDVDGAGALFAVLTNCRLIAAIPAVDIMNASATVQLSHCEVSSSQNTSSVGVVRIDTAKRFLMTGGLLYGTGATKCEGVELEGTIGAVTLNGVSFKDLNNFIIRNSGQTDRMTAIGCEGETTTRFISWTASFPDMMHLVGNSMQTGAFQTGFTATTADVNQKANNAASTPIKETPIVP